MESTDNFDKKLRNISLIFTISSFFLMLGGSIFSFISHSLQYYIIMVLGVIIFFPSVFILTRIQ
ncbi:MAG: hypothetical protein ACFE9R_19235, partial [Candidatus Hermodarchaeota archaeon]